VTQKIWIDKSLTLVAAFTMSGEDQTSSHAENNWSRTLWDCRMTIFINTSANLKKKLHSFGPENLGDVQQVSQSEKQRKQKKNPLDCVTEVLIDCDDLQSLEDLISTNGTSVRGLHSNKQL